jgi:hypothetical protein
MDWAASHEELTTGGDRALYLLPSPAEGRIWKVGERRMSIFLSPLGRPAGGYVLTAAPGTGAPSLRRGPAS